MNVFRLCRKQAEMVVAATITDMGVGRQKEEVKSAKSWVSAVRMHWQQQKYLVK